MRGAIGDSPIAPTGAPRGILGNLPSTGLGPQGVLVVRPPGFAPRAAPGRGCVATPGGAASRPTRMTPHDGAPRWTRHAEHIRNKYAGQEKSRNVHIAQMRLDRMTCRCRHGDSARAVIFRGSHHGWIPPARLKLRRASECSPSKREGRRWEGEDRPRSHLGPLRVVRSLAERPLYTSEQPYSGH